MNHVNYCAVILSFSQHVAHFFRFQIWEFFQHKKILTPLQEGLTMGRNFSRQSMVGLCCLLALALAFSWPVPTSAFVTRTTTTTIETATTTSLGATRNGHNTGAATRFMSSPYASLTNAMSIHWQRRQAVLDGRSTVNTRQLRTAVTSSSSSTSLSSSAYAASFGMDAAVASASIAATLKLLASIGLGGLAAKKKDLLDADAIATLSKLTYWVFQPSFLFASVATTLCNTATGVGGMPSTILPLMFSACTVSLGISFWLSQIVSKAVGFRGDEARDVQMCITFQNCGPLPLVFADALFQDGLLADVTSCISFYLLAWSPIFWTLGRIIIGTYGDSINDASRRPQRIKQEIKKFLSPPVMGALFGVLVGGTPLLRMAFFNGAAMPLFGALKTLGSAYLPAALLVLAGSLFSSTNTMQQRELVNGETEKKSIDMPVPAAPSFKATASILFTRFVFTPAIALGLSTFFGNMGWLGVAGSRARAVATFVLLMEGCMPPAQNSVLLYSLSDKKQRASGMARMLALMYSLAVVPVTLLLSACIEFSGIAAFR